MLLDLSSVIGRGKGDGCALPNSLRGHLLLVLGDKPMTAVDTKAVQLITSG